MKIWKQARELARRTPPERNRYVDFLRAGSILVVIAGHWLITTVYFSGGELFAGHLFDVQPPIQWLTWAFQVMPVFFIVGGYANAVSLERARQRRTAYADWLGGRLQRLITPLLALIAAWGLIAASMFGFGVAAATIQSVSRAALIPTWFLAIYIMVVVLAPAMYRLWRRFGFWSFWALAGMAVLMDLLFFAGGIRWPAWSSYFWVWMAVHNLGFAWHGGRTGGAPAMLLIAAFGFAVLWLLVFEGPYPLAMVGFPDQDPSNTTPPKITLIALALLQFGLLRALEKPLGRALDSLRLWTATVLINGMIMSIYLWHLTLMIVVIGLLYLAGGAGLGIEPGTLAWWLTRPLWIGGLALMLLPLALALSPLERLARGRQSANPAPWRLAGGAALVCLGVALLALFGVGGGPLPGLGSGAFALVLVGAAVGGLLPWRAVRGEGHE